MGSYPPPLSGFVDEGMNTIDETGRWYLHNGRLNEGIHALESISKPDSNALLWLGILHMKQGSDGKAEDYLRSALLTARENSDSSVVPVCFCMLSRVNTDRGNYSTALDLVEKAKEASAQEEDRRSEALAFHALAYCLRISRDFDGSIEAYKSAIQIYLDEGDSQRMNDEIRNLATAMFLNGEMDEVAKLLGELQGKLSRGEPYFEAYSHVDEAILSFIEGRFEESQSEIKKAHSAIEACEQTLDPDEEMVVEYLSNRIPR
jgi:tetratricopeptide (TPR) repeat protein